MSWNTGFSISEPYNVVMSSYNCRFSVVLRYTLIEPLKIGHLPKRNLIFQTLECSGASAVSFRETKHSSTWWICVFLFFLSNNKLLRSDEVFLLVVPKTTLTFLKIAEWQVCEYEIRPNYNISPTYPWNKDNFPSSATELRSCEVNSFQLYLP